MSLAGGAAAFAAGSHGFSRATAQAVRAAPLGGARGLPRFASRAPPPSRAASSSSACGLAHASSGVEAVCLAPPFSSALNVGSSVSSFGVDTRGMLPSMLQRSALSFSPRPVWFACARRGFCSGEADNSVNDADGGGWPPRLRLRGLSFKVTEAEIRDFFGGFALADGAEGQGGRVDLIFGEEDGLPTGQAFVYFRTWEEAMRAREEKHRGYLRNRWIEMYVDWSP